MRLIDANVALQRFIEETETSGKNVIHINTIKRLLWDMDASCYGEIYAQGYNQGTIDRAEEVTKAREQGYNKAIDDFLGKIKEHYKLCKAVPSYYLLEEIAEKMRGAKCQSKS